MKDITNILKRIGFGLAVVALTSIPLSAQKNKDDKYCLSGDSKKYTHNTYSNVKKKDTYCLSDEGKHYNKNVYSESRNGKPLFISKGARNYYRKVSAKEKDNNSCVQNGYMKYHSNLHKITGMRQR